MPPNSGNQIYGDLVLNPAQNVSRHGPGKLTIKSDLELNGDALVPQKLSTTAADLQINAAKELGLKSVAGDVTLNFLYFDI